MVLAQEVWQQQAAVLGFDLYNKDILATAPVRQWLLQRIAARLADFPAYAVVREVTVQARPWTIDDGTMTPTMKLRRTEIIEQSQDRIEQMYQGH